MNSFIRSFQIFLVLFLCLNIEFVYGQDYFIKDVGISSLERPSVEILADDGWVVYAPDNSILMRYDKCGTVIWAKQMDVLNEGCCTGGQVVVLDNENVAVLQREKIGANYGLRISVMDRNGVLVWSQQLTNVDASYYPYSIIKDRQGNILTYAAESPTGGGQDYRIVIKISPSSVILWAKKYQVTSIWGAALATSDGGSLNRSGDSFFKLDGSGNLEWSTQINSTLTYDYFAPIEVSDGYIFTKSKDGTSELGFFKISKTGTLLWDKGRFIENVATHVVNLQSLKNGNFVAFLNINGQGNPVLIEFDSDLNVRRTSKLGFSSSNFQLFDLTQASTGDVIVVGNELLGSNTLAVGKLTSNYQSGCSLNYPFNIREEPVSVTTSSVLEVPTHIAQNYLPLVLNDIPINEVNICEMNVGKSVNLGSDTTICNDDSLVLADRNITRYESYLWSTDETSSSIKVSEPGIYWLRVKAYCDLNDYSDTILIGKSVISDPMGWKVNEDLCSSEKVTLNAEVLDATYVWDDGSKSAILEVNKPGVYTVTIYDQGCTSVLRSQVSDCENFQIPNIFSPNNDGVNDFFFLSYDGTQNFSIRIFNRWGVEQFQSDFTGFSWDGRTSSGERVPAGVYFYILTIGDKTYKGALSLIK